MSPEEYDEWKTYYSFEPWGSPIEDDRFRRLYQLHWYGAGKSFEGDLPSYFLLDRDPEETDRLKAEAEAAIDPVDDLIAFMSSRAVPGAPAEPPPA